MNNNYEEVLYGMGANWVITPERSTAKELASNILRYNISNVFHLEDDVALIELKIPKEWAGKSLAYIKSKTEIITSMLLVLEMSKMAS